MTVAFLERDLDGKRENRGGGEENLNGNFRNKMPKESFSEITVTRLVNLRK